MSPFRKRIFHLPAAIFLILLTLFLYHKNADELYERWTTALEALPEKPPANRTLGFGAVLVVSKEGSERRHALLQAANVTEIDMKIPKQPAWTNDEVDRFRNGQDKDVQRGSLLAWMGHLNVLKWFLASGLETALILEDDVDFDIRLRSVQIPLAASAARLLLPPVRQHSPFTSFGRKQHAQYWGDTSAWDLLYIGHCGDYFHPLTYDGLALKEGFSLEGLAHHVYTDPSLPTKEDLHPFTHSLMDVLNMTNHQRVFHRSKFPLCSFGYAVTRSAAKKLLEDLAPPRLTPEGPTAFDVALLHACVKGSVLPSPTQQEIRRYAPSYHHRKHDNTGLRCWTVNPELFHHMPGESQIARIGESLGHVIGIPPVDASGEEQVRIRNETSNIGCGFWSGAFAFDDDDHHERLEYLQKEVGRQGKCLKDG
ncbi:glycosyltransferase family 25 protein [Sporormia fimetaria CBS 119925]|uniref:Glycosyltransferase family 25 protein n=1 Tax=Sporormia fimetaria CBS 119925 TaxID=1340428 RepID=A0A6A6VG56_9PLEO|nr:glycosyltransferase family 25 protein [Sporormia fimetaria CBS 119925]